MDAVVDLLQSLVNVFWSLLDVVVALAIVIVPWLPLLAWVTFWTLAVNWVKAFDILRRGGFIGLLLLMFVAIMVWGAVSPPVDGHHTLFGLTVSNYVGKFMYVTALTCIALLCGSVQLSGACPAWCRFPEDEEPSHEVHATAGHH